MAVAVTRGLRTATLLLLALPCAAGAALIEGKGGSPGGPGEFLEVSGGRIHYEECGAGAAVVLLHDGLLHSVVWDGVWPRLCRQFHVLRYDRRGYGQSDPPKAAFSPVEDLAALLAHAKVQRASVVGCSSGSALAIDFAIHHPESVENLVLIGPVVHGLPSSSFFDERGRQNSAPLEKGDVKGAARNWSEDRFEIAAGHDAARRTVFDALARNPGNLKYTGEFELRFKVPGIARLSEIHVPTLILAGEHDIADVHAHSGAIQAGIRGSRREIVKNSGHLVPLEAPDDLSARISGFIEKHRVVAVPEKTLESYAARYRLWGNVAEVVLKNGRLTLNAPTEQESPIFPSSDTKFFMIVWGEAELEFLKDGDGRVTGFELKQGKSVDRAERISGGP
jgi:pimeloyl-ACP methyl ester carboxylesterase